MIYEFAPRFCWRLPFQSTTFHRVEEKTVWEYYATGRGEVGKTVQYAEQGIPAYNELVI